MVMQLAYDQDTPCQRGLEHSYLNLGQALITKSHARCISQKGYVPMEATLPSGPC